MSETIFNPKISDPENYFKTIPVADEYSVTAILPDMNGVVQYMEKEALAPHGYYRLVKHPYNRATELNLEELYGFKEAILFCSPETALRELIDLLQSQLQFTKISVMPSAPMRQRHWETRFLSLNLNSTFDLDFAEDAGLLVYKFHEKPESEKCAVFYSDVYEKPESLPQDTDYAIVALPNGAGAALLTNHTENAEIIYDRNKKRGAMISARELAPLLGFDECAKVSDEEMEQCKKKLCKLSNAEHVSLYPSGMNAVATALDLYKKPGKNHFLIIGHVYSDSHYMITEVPWRDEAAEFDFIDSDKTHEINERVKENTCCILVETITNPLIEIPDIPEICKIGETLRLPVVVDNTMASPYNFKPLDHGATLSVESTTKYLAGNNLHGGGAIFTNNLMTKAILKDRQNIWKNTLSPYEIAPLTAGLATYNERMERFNKNGLEIAEFLEAQEEVETVYFAGLPSSPYYEKAQELLKGTASVVSFILKGENLDKVNAFYGADLGDIKKAPSLGSDQTLMCPYVLLTYYHKDDEYLETIPLSRYLIRVAVGSEKDINSIKESLKSGLKAAQNV